ncbi:MAG TPA: hypothetical protein VHX16_00690, partial [Chloroflexota bacterium]|nr:hypothetical protein [Chloroflexota bacterium]
GGAAGAPQAALINTETTMTPKKPGAFTAILPLASRKRSAVLDGSALSRASLAGYYAPGLGGCQRY